MDRIFEPFMICSLAGGLQSSAYDLWQIHLSLPTPTNSSRLERPQSPHPIMSLLSPSCGPAHEHIDRAGEHATSCIIQRHARLSCLIRTSSCSPFGDHRPRAHSLLNNTEVHNVFTSRIYPECNASGHCYRIQIEMSHCRAFEASL